LKLKRPDGTSESYVVTQTGGRFHCPLCSVHFAHASGVRRHFTTEHVEKNRPPSDPSEETSAASLLESVGCHVDSLYRLLICDNDQCHHALSPTTFRYHVSGHGFTLSTEEIELVLRVHRPLDISAFFETHPKPIHPVSTIPVFPGGYLCGFEGCNGVFDSDSALRKHCGRKHENRNLRELFGRGPYQSLFGPKSKNARVVVEVDETASTLRETAFMRSIPEPLDQDLANTPESGLSSFLRMTKWHLFLSKLRMSPVEYQALVNIPPSRMTEPQLWLRDVVRKYTKSIVPDVDEAETLSLQMINTKQ
jgi:hypothetical protein